MEFGKRLLVFLFIIILLGTLAYYYPYLTGETVRDSNVQYQKESAFVIRIIDGDTIVVSGDEIGNQTHIRLLGINTPEKKMPYSKEAAEFLKHLEGKGIELLRDREDSDKYKRKLRYVFYDNKLINTEILQEGLATSFMTNGLKYETNLKNAELFARNNKIKLWKESKDECASCIKLVELNFKNEYFTIKNDCDFSCNLTGWVVKDDANHFFYLKELNAFESKTYNSNIDELKKTKEVWNDNGDRFFMRDKKGGLVIFYDYDDKGL